ncbi:MAG TPA: protein kinase [Kofleriaceae bacterium]|jgi:serine/threonine protein kinase
MDPAAHRPVSNAGLPSSLGEFRIVAVLGEGGSGIVYDAVWGPRRVALKVLHPQLADTERVRAQFFAEAQRLQAISHPSVVKVLSVGELPDKRPYLAMERLDGETLAHVIGRGRIPLAHALELFSELCAAVATLHADALVHRDLKPENVFVVDGKHAVLLDFGIAKDLYAGASTSTMEGNVRGTPAYMAPERFFGQSASVATDVYELAVTLYAMLGGALPWDDVADPEARLSPRSLIDVGADVPGDLDVEIRRALSTRAQNRPASASALLDAVRSAAKGARTDAGETARMRPQTNPPPLGSVTKSAVERATKRTDPAFDTDPPVVTTPARRSRAWLAAPVAIAAIGAVVAWRVVIRKDAPVVVATDPHDPWGDHAAASPVAPIETPGDKTVSPTPDDIPTTGDSISLDTGVTEVAAAIPHLPAGTHVMLAAIIGPLRRDPRFTTLFDKIVAMPQVQGIALAMPACFKKLANGAEWVVVGTPDFTGHEHAVFIVRGRWDKAGVLSCFAKDAVATTVGADTVYKLPSLGVLDFLDDHTFYMNMKDGIDAAEVHADVTRKTPGMTKHAQELLASLKTPSALTFVADGSKLTWPDGTLPPGGDAVGWIRVHPNGAQFQVVLDTKDIALSDALVKKFKDDLKEVFDQPEAVVGTIGAHRDDTKVIVDGDLKNFVLSMIAGALPG